MRNADGPTLISRAEVALHAGVGRAAVSNWESRHEDFPRPVRRGNQEAFDPVAVATWLDGRLIPSKGLRDGEPDGLDYGSRFRHSLGLSCPTALAASNEGAASQIEVAASPTASEGPTVETPGARAVQWLLDRLKGTGSPSAFFWLAFLFYLRELHAPIWAQVKESVSSVRGWYLFEEAWRCVAHVDPAFREIPTPELPAYTVTVEPSWSPGSVVHLVEEAHRLAASTPERARGRSPAADIFVHLIERHAQAQGRHSGEYLTPRAVVRLAVAAVAGASPNALRLYDPFCRAGEFLDEAVTRASGDRSNEIQVYGHSPNRALRSLTQMNLRLHGVEPYIDGNHWWDGVPPQQFDFIFANPPFNMRLTEELVRQRSWRYGPPPAHNGNYAWLQHVVSLLRTGGRAAVVMPNNASFTTNARESVIRAAMIDDGVVECVIGLPPNLFTGTGIPVSLWLLRAPAGQPLDVLFIDATGLGTPVTRALRTLSSETTSRIVRTLDRWRDGKNVDKPGFSQAVSGVNLRRDYRLNPAIHVEPYRPDRDMTAERSRITDLLRQSSLLGEQIRPVDGAVGQLATLIDAGGAAVPYRRTVPLGELCDLKAGPGGGRLHSRVQRTEGVPVVLPRHLKDGKITDWPDAGIPPEITRGLTTYRLEADDVVVSRTVERGRVARIFPKQRGWLFSTGLIRLRIHSQRILPGYLAHVLLSEECHAWMVRHTAGTIVPAITLPMLARLPITVPPREEQESIASALDAIAEQSRIHAELATAARSLREALARSLFVMSGE